MMGILADINAGKHLRAILTVWHTDDWRELWYGLGLSVESFPALGLPYDSSDAVIWKICQAERLVLVTANRNADEPDSLEAVNRAENQSDSLPIVTLADPDRVLKDRLYAEIVAEQLLEKLIAIDDFRGAGRLYVP
jgi:hypothetical protein